MKPRYAEKTRKDQKQVCGNEWMTEWMDASREEEQSRQTIPLPLQLYSTVDGRSSAHRPSPSQACSTPSTPRSTRHPSHIKGGHCSSTKKRDMSLKDKRSMARRGWSETETEVRPGRVAPHSVPSPRKIGASAKMIQGLVDKKCTAYSRLPETDTHTEV